MVKPALFVEMSEHSLELNIDERLQKFVKNGIKYVHFIEWTALEINA